MNLIRRLRAGSTPWAFPLVIGLILLYFFKSFAIDYKVPDHQPKYAPSVTSSVLLSFYSLSYAISSSLSAWESGRLKANGVWEIAPSRSRIGIAFNVLAPVVALSWLMLVLPVAMALIATDTAPTLGVLPLLIMAMFVTTAHSVVGFGIGLRVPRLIATPILAVGVFFFISASWSYEPFWIRHISGQFPVDLMFAESANIISLTPHILFIGSFALGIVTLSIPSFSKVSRSCITTAACAIWVFGLLAPYAIAKNWGAVPPLSAGNVAMECSEQSPEVCLPAGTGTEAASARAEIVVALEKLKGAGVPVEAPQSVIDSVVNRRHPVPSTRSRWQLPLIASQQEGTTQLQVVRKVTEPPCRNSVSDIHARSILLWSAGIVGQQDNYLRQQRLELSNFKNREEIIALEEKRVARVQSMSPAAQLEWYKKERKQACEPKQQTGAN
ncbi:hypothetical protein [Streptomyces sp. NPDC048565]|uniref:hypothetical protein n=1 Tax=Streptomyces sp. NPDC048565 TaxID=3155266 RepID=UPI003432F0C5